jgi:hypothetical protein
MRKFRIMIDVTLEAYSRVLAENEAKRIYKGLDDCVSEQNNPKDYIINLVLAEADSGRIIRTIIVERAKR